MPVGISDVSICNLALVKLGQGPIGGLSEDTKNANLCAAVYEYLRNEVLESHPWQFATSEVELADTPWTPSGASCWTYKFPLPTDWLCMQRGPDWKENFEVIDRYLYANETPFAIKYTREETNTGKYSYAFANTLSWRIAAELAYAITNSDAKAKTMMDGYMAFIREARYNDSHKRSPEGPVIDTFIDARY